MAMYYYASKLNEASCSGCSVKVPPVSEPATTSTDYVPLTVDPALLHGSGLSYYDNDDYYSMVRGNKLMSESSCKHMVMNGGLGYKSSQKVEPGQNQGNGGVSVGMGVGGGEEVEYRDGQLVSASLEALVDMLRPGAPPSFTFTFLLCSRLFLKPHELLAKLCKRYFKNYDKPGKADESKECPEKELADMGALVRVLTQWTGMFPYDFRDDRVMALVRTITQRSASEQMAGMRSEVSRTLERLLDRLTALEQYEQSLPEPAPLCTVEQLPQGDILTLGLSPVELARQLTAVELYRLSFVGPEEFLQAFSPPAAKSPAVPKTTRNLEAYADWFNRLSYLVATDIVKPVKSKQRARLLEQWVTTARECFNLGNFNSLMAIISALNMAPIARLKKRGVVRLQCVASSCASWSCAWNLEATMPGTARRWRRRRARRRCLSSQSPVVTCTSRTNPRPQECQVGVSTLRSAVRWRGRCALSWRRDGWARHTAHRIAPPTPSTRTSQTRPLGDSSLTDPRYPKQLWSWCHSSASPRPTTWRRSG